MASVQVGLRTANLRQTALGCPNKPGWKMQSCPVVSVFRDTFTNGSKAQPNTQQQEPHSVRGRSHLAACRIPSCQSQSGTIKTLFLPSLPALQQLPIIILGTQELKSNVCSWFTLAHIWTAALVGTKIHSFIPS